MQEEGKKKQKQRNRNKFRNKKKAHSMQTNWIIIIETVQLTSHVI